MGQKYTEIPEKLYTFIQQQRIFFVATADCDGRINISPKGLDSLRILNKNRYFNDLTQWNEETIRQRANVLANMALEIWPYFGKVQTDSNLSADDMKGKKPVSVTIMGDSYSVSSWRDVMQKTLESIITMDTDSEIFNKILKQFPQNISLEKKFRSSRRLSNGSYIETNIDARGIYKFCRDLIQLAELSDSDWQVEIIS